MTQTQKPLRKKVVNAGFWSFLLHAGSRLLGFARTLVIARLLAPDDIGLFAIATIALTLIETFLNPGLQSALIQKKGNIAEDLNVAWTVQMLLGLFKAAILFFIAPLISDFFQVPSVTGFIRTIALAMFINGFLNIGVVLLRKELNFKKHFAFMLSGIIADLVVAVSAAIYLRSPWALVYGIVARYSIQTVLSFFIHPFRPKLDLKSTILKKLIGYGVWINLMGSMVFLARDGVRIVIGKFVDTYALGIYQVASWITESALVEMAGMLGVVAFSAYSKIQNDRIALRNAYIRTAGFKLSFILPLTAGIILSGDLFISLFLGDKWSGSIPVLKLLALSGCFLAIANTSQPVFMALGKPKFSFLLQMMRAVTLLCVVIPFTLEKGVAGAATATVVSNAVALCLGLYFIKRVLSLSRQDFTKLFAPCFIATMALILVMASSRLLLDTIYHVQRFESFFAIILAGVLVYLLILKKLESQFPDNQPLQAVSLLAGNGLNKNAKSPETV